MSSAAEGKTVEFETGSIQYIDAFSISHQNHTFAVCWKIVSVSMGVWMESDFNRPTSVCVCGLTLQSTVWLDSSENYPMKLAKVLSPKCYFHRKQSLFSLSSIRGFVWFSLCQFQKCILLNYWSFFSNVFKQFYSCYMPSTGMSFLSDCGSIRVRAANLMDPMVVWWCYEKRGKK